LTILLNKTEKRAIKKAYVEGIFGLLSFSPGGLARVLQQELAHLIQARLQNITYFVTWSDHNYVPYSVPDYLFE
jgi:hypothetical protein